MPRAPSPEPDWVAPPEAIAHAVAQVENSAGFRRSPRHRHLLRHLVTQALEGATSALKESVIAVEVFGRPAAEFDPRRDSIVRVETRRLRSRLTAYYGGEGQAAVLRIELPVGSYVPQFVRRCGGRADARATRRARDLVERGEHFLRQATSKPMLEAAIERFDAAQRESPRYAPACVGLARAWFNMASGWYCDARLAADHAQEALKHALALDDTRADAWALLGAVQHQFEQDWPAARRSLRRAVALAPRQAFCHTAYGWQLVARGLLDEAERELSLARELDPQYVNSRVHMVNLRIAQGRLADAQREVEAMRDIAPHSMVVAGMEGALALFRHQPGPAVAAYRRACALAPEHPQCHLLLASALASAGRPEAARSLIKRTLARFADRCISPYVMAICATRLGEHDRAIAALHQALDEHDPQVVLFALDPSFAALHGHPAWAACRARLGLPASR